MSFDSLLRKTVLLATVLHGTFHSVRWARFGEPARDLDLVLGKETYPILTGGVQVTVERVLYAVEREEGHGGRDANVYPKHPGLYVLAPVPDGGAVLGEDAAGVAERRAVVELDCLVEALYPDHREHGAEDLLAPDPHLASHAVEYRRSHKEACFERRLATVEDYLRPLFFADGHVLPYLLAMGVANHRRQLALLLLARPDLHGGGLFFERLDQRVGDIADGYEHAPG